MTQAYLNYIGAGLYSIPVFEAEAKRAGVSRGIATRILKTMSFGDKVLLAQWLPDYVAQERAKFALRDENGNLLGKQKYFRIGSAKVFGFFTVSGIHFTCSGPEQSAADAIDALVRSLHIVETVTSNERVARMCGSGIIAYRHFVTDSIEDIVANAQMLEELTGAKFKFFATGQYQGIPEMTLDPAKFSRGVVKVTVEGELAPFLEPSTIIDSNELAFVYDYSRRMYVSKDERERAEKEAGA